MYIPAKYREIDNDEIYRIVKHAPAGTLLLNGEETPMLVMIPFVLPEEKWPSPIEFHLSAANPVSGMLHNSKASILFQGPLDYISAGWYDHINVSTLNYLAVQISGPVEEITDPVQIRAHLGRLTTHYEQHIGGKYRIEQLPQDYVEQERQGLRAFVMNPERWHAAAKLSQNRDDKNYALILKELKERSPELYEEMLRKRPNAGEL